MPVVEEFIATGNIADVRRLIRQARAAGRRIGCVPTMGALHAGHVSLFEECARHADFVVGTIFVNPTQFAPHEDLAKYPRPLEADLNAARQAGVSLVFTPTEPVMYGTGFSTYVTVEDLSVPWEGAIRPTHFRGVATIVLKLLNILQPDVAVFGAKDWQQQALIRKMVCDLNVPVEIVTAPTVREADGLAMSSRNVYLSAKERRSSLALSKSLELAESRLQAGERDIAAIESEMLELLKGAPQVEPDYAVVVHPDTLERLPEPQTRMVVLVAARVGSTRLIDNREVVLWREA
jgi:pantoate--beta-alanine ligase